MSLSKQKSDEVSRPRLSPDLKDRINKLADRLKIENMPLSNVNNILCSIGLECLERSLDHFQKELKEVDFVKKVLQNHL